MATTFKDWPNIRERSIDGIIDFLNYICRTRDDDISVVDNFPNIFMMGRKVGKIPTSSLDIIPTDRVGDFNYDANYLYIVVTSLGIAEWRRVSLGTW